MSFLPLFFGCWIYGIASHGFLFGLRFGWISAPVFFHIAVHGDRPKLVALGIFNLDHLMSGPGKLAPPFECLTVETYN